MNGTYVGIPRNPLPLSSQKLSLTLEFISHPLFGIQQYYAQPNQAQTPGLMQDTSLIQSYTAKLP